MSDWNTGNFDSDDALDYVDRMCKVIIADIDRMVTKKRFDGHEFLTKAMPRIAVLALLVNSCRTLGPKKKTIHRWQERFLPLFDQDAADIYDDPGHAKERRGVIVRTFHTLEKWARDPESPE